MEKKEKISFKDLNNWDIFETEDGNYYLKTDSNNEFNAILLTGKKVECFSFEDDILVSKF